MRVVPGETMSASSVDVMPPNCRLPANVLSQLGSWHGRGKVAFKNGYEVSTNQPWLEFVAECILVHDLPPIER